MIKLFFVFLVFQMKAQEFVWPKPPDEPKLKFVEFLVTKEDITGESFFKKVFRKLIGQKKTRLFYFPFGIWVDSKDRIFVADPKMPGIVIIDQKSKRVSWKQNAGNLKFIRPTGIAFSEKKNAVYIADPGDFSVYAISYDKWEPIFIIKKPLGKPVNLALDDYRARLYIADDSLHAIFVFDLDGKYLFKIGEKGNEPGKFLYPMSIAVDDDANIYVTEWGNFRVQILNTRGEVLNYFGKAGNAPGNFVRPKGVAVDDEGFIFVSDAYLHRVQVFDKFGNVYLGIEGVGWNPGNFRLPAGIFIRNNKIYIVEQMNARIQIWEKTGSWH